MPRFVKRHGLCMGIYTRIKEKGRIVEVCSVCDAERIAKAQKLLKKKNS